MSMTNYFVGSLDMIEFVVIFTRYKDKWVYCWHKKRKSFEHPAGHVERNESPLQAAKRELLGSMPQSEMDRIELFDTVPDNYTYEREDEIRDLQMVEKIWKTYKE